MNRLMIPEEDLKNQTAADPEGPVDMQSEMMDRFDRLPEAKKIARHLRQDLRGEIIQAIGRSSISFRPRLAVLAGKSRLPFWRN